MDENRLRKGRKVKVVADHGTDGILVNPKHLSIRSIGMQGTLLSWVPGHGGDVWFVEQSNGIAAYCFTELEEITPLDVLKTWLRNFFDIRSLHG